MGIGEWLRLKSNVSATLLRPWLKPAKELKSQSRPSMPELAIE
jgi:hypothetical protein